VDPGEVDASKQSEKGASMPNATPLYVRLLAGLVSPFPDFDFGFIKPLRARAVGLLQLRRGARVIDAGCGSGGSFPFLLDAVGPTGSLVGIELSVPSGEHARRRADRNGWANVEVVVAAAEDAVLAGSYDGLLMFAAPDVYASKASLDRLLPHLADGARVVFFGGKRSTRRFGWLFNGLLHLALTKFSLPTTPGLEDEPWRLIAPWLTGLEVEERFFGWMFLASGTVARPVSATPS
jgi:SAM-dependent methyltransferase